MQMQPCLVLDDATYVSDETIAWQKQFHQTKHKIMSNRPRIWYGIYDDIHKIVLQCLKYHSETG